MAKWMANERATIIGSATSAPASASARSQCPPRARVGQSTIALFSRGQASASVPAPLRSTGQDLDVALHLPSTSRSPAQYCRTTRSSRCVGSDVGAAMAKLIYASNVSLDGCTTWNTHSARCPQSHSVEAPRCTYSDTSRSCTEPPAASSGGGSWAPEYCSCSSRSRPSCRRSRHSPSSAPYASSWWRGRRSVTAPIALESDIPSPHRRKRPTVSPRDDCARDERCRVGSPTVTTPEQGEPHSCPRVAIVDFLAA